MVQSLTYSLHWPFAVDFGPAMLAEILKKLGWGSTTCHFCALLSEHPCRDPGRNSACIPKPVARVTASPKSMMPYRRIHGPWNLMRANELTKIQGKMIIH